MQFANYNSQDYTLSRGPRIGLGEKVEDNVIRSPFEAGYEHTRPRFTRKRRTFSLDFVGLADADKTTIDSLFDAVQGADEFTYTHIIDSQNYTVRFASPPEFKRASMDTWSCQMVLVEV